MVRHRGMTSLSEILSMRAFDNPRLHDIPLLIASFRDHGFVRTIAINERDQTILFGHGAAQALMQMKDDGMDPPEGIEIAEDGDWLLPTERGIDMASRRARAYRIMDNRSTERGGWDHPILATVLSDLEKLGMVSESGFTLEEAQALIQAQTDPDSGDEERPIKIYTCPECGQEMDRYGNPQD